MNESEPLVNKFKRSKTGLGLIIFSNFNALTFNVFTETDLSPPPLRGTFLPKRNNSLPSDLKDFHEGRRNLYKYLPFYSVHGMQSFVQSTTNLFKGEEEEEEEKKEVICVPYKIGLEQEEEERLKEDNLTVPLFFAVMVAILSQFVTGIVIHLFDRRRKTKIYEKMRRLQNCI